MFIECQRFVEFGDQWFKHEPQRGRQDMVFEPIILNTEYVATVRRYPIHGGIEFCMVWMVDQGNSFAVDKTYEEMRALLKVARSPDYMAAVRDVVNPR